ncbi:hypothetical protein CTAM01_11889, partial [Colletotrichum tamarilloi]
SQEVDADYEGEDGEASLTLPLSNRVGPELREFWPLMLTAQRRAEYTRFRPIMSGSGYLRDTQRLRERERRFQPPFGEGGDGDRPAFFTGDDTAGGRVFQHDAGLPSCM